MSRRDQRNNSPKTEAHRKAQEKWEAKQKQKLANVDLRQIARDARSDEAQLELLDKKLGVGVGAKKERERLLNRINSKKETKND